MTQNIFADGGAIGRRDGVVLLEIGAGSWQLTASAQATDPSQLSCALDAQEAVATYGAASFGDGSSFTTYTVTTDEFGVVSLSCTSGTATIVSMGLTALPLATGA